MKNNQSDIVASIGLPDKHYRVMDMIILYVDMLAQGRIPLRGVEPSAIHLN